jgi:hypothetical protein
LDDLNLLFPEHDLSDLRQALSRQSCCNLYLAIDDLMQFERVLEKQKRTDLLLRTRVGLDRGAIEPRQRYRSEEYQRAVYRRLRLEFAQHDYPSTIRAVLDEKNYDYERTKIELTSIFKKRTLWSVFKGLFSWSKENVEQKLRQGTGCEELDAEIEAVAARKFQTEIAKQIESDSTLAQKTNDEEYTATNEMIECGCCFGDYTWEDLTSCNGGHLICRSCVTRTVQECAFGQADAAYTDRGLRCIAASSESCDSEIPNNRLRQVLPLDLWARYTGRIMSTELESAHLDLVRCPFCPYAEFKEKVTQPHQPQVRLRLYLQHVVTLFLSLTTLIAPLILVNVTLPLILYIYWKNLFQSKNITRLINESRERQRETPEEGSKIFKCQNVDACGRESCVDCGKEWAPFHDCLRTEKDGLRLYVEKAMADAIKRTVRCILDSLMIVSEMSCEFCQVRWV